MASTQVACPFCWFDMPFDDQKRASTFYREVFGLEFQEMGSPDNPYFGLAGSEKTGGESIGMVGGMMPRQHPKHGAMIYFQVPDLESWHAKVIEHGGQVLERDIPAGEMGIFSICLDSEGNSIALWKNL